MVESSVITDISIDQLNALNTDEATTFFTHICHCQRWANDMCAARPFTDLTAVLSVAETLWSEASEAEILEAFQGHARIGDLSAMKEKYSAASKEQGQVALADERVLQELLVKNNEYFDKNGFIFIVCATGKSAEEMLTLLLARLDNPRQDELKNGAVEQGKITHLRLSSRITN
ncbi:2-oxo-4-hydroxy-4-carboxy-5-ureidoimidazoline decarboxylase [Sessilibacter corallicola]|uniref:2-oxo-4-hydroxy-4-carboxy-5-ureidoimidazoline decarboxylase n=1 Tax=Sessilibacter corallicola TaxID=2904075 RepID=A0ABQ0A7G3_9GAMM